MDAAVLAAQKYLKPFFMKAQVLNIVHLRQKTIESVAAALPVLAELLLADVDEEQYRNTNLSTIFCKSIGMR